MIHTLSDCFDDMLSTMSLLHSVNTQMKSNPLAFSVANNNLTLNHTYIWTATDLCIFDHIYFLFRNISNLKETQRESRCDQINNLTLLINYYIQGDQHSIIIIIINIIIIKITIKLPCIYIKIAYNMVMYI